MVASVSGDSESDPYLPPIRVIVVKGAEDVTIKIADRAGGVPRSLARRVWSFAHTDSGPVTMEREKDSEFEIDEVSEVVAM